MFGFFRTFPVETLTLLIYQTDELLISHVPSWGHYLVIMIEVPNIIASCLYLPYMIIALEDNYNFNSLFIL